MEVLNEFVSRITKEEAKEFAEKKWGVFYGEGIDNFVLAINPLRGSAKMLLPETEYNYLVVNGYWDKGISRIKDIPRSPDNALLELRIKSIIQELEEILSDLNNH